LGNGHAQRSQTAMVIRAHRHLAALVSLAALLATLSVAQVALANFSGTVHDISKKQVTIDTGDGNLLDFEINRKTKVLRGKTEIKPEDIMTGDQVTIEGRQEMLKFLVAVSITVQPPPDSGH
jgi:DNA/RNA endonuclease YhcR with UshA esterase domain